MVLDLPQLQRASPKPLVEQIVRHFEAAIAHGRIRPGERLPTIREAAGRLQVTRGVIQQAYRRLGDQGLVEGTVGRGTTVVGAEPAAPGSPLISPLLQAARAQLEAQRDPAPPPGVELVASFDRLVPDQALFPVDEFRASLERVLRHDGGDLLVYGHPMGRPELRALLASRAHGADPPGSAEEILVTSGAQQGIDLVLRTLTSPGDAVVVPVPTYHHLLALVRAHGLDLVPVRLGEAGIDPDELRHALRAPRVRLVYVMPTFHNPTGLALTLPQREAFTQALAGTAVPVLEDDFQHELRFAGAATPSLRRLDARGLTITLRTFSKGLFPGLRIGWIQAAPELLAPMAVLKRITDLETTPLLQAALVDFAVRGTLDRYLGKLRPELARRHAAARRALEKHLPKGSRWTEPEGGFLRWVDGPAGIDGSRLAELAATRGVLVTPGRVFHPDDRPCTGMRLSLSRTAPAQIERGIAILGACARELRQEPLERRNFL